MSPETGLSVMAAIVAASVTIGLFKAPRTPIPVSDSSRTLLPKMVVVAATRVAALVIVPLFVELVTATLPQLDWLVSVDPARSEFSSASRIPSVTPVFAVTMMFEPSVRR